MPATSVQQDIFGNYGDQDTPERPSAKVLRDLIALGCDRDLANGFTKAQAFAVLRSMQRKAERERQAKLKARTVKDQATQATDPEPPARVDNADPVYPEPLRWHLFPWDRPALAEVLNGLNEMRRLAPEVILPRCVFWSIRHLPSESLSRLIDWLREELTDVAGRSETTGGTAASGGDERLECRGRRDHDAPPHISDAPRPTAAEPARGLARHAEDEADREPEPVDEPFDES